MRYESVSVILYQLSAGEATNLLLPATAESLSRFVD